MESLASLDLTIVGLSECRLINYLYSFHKNSLYITIEKYATMLTKRWLLPLRVYSLTIKLELGFVQCQMSVRRSSEPFSKILFVLGVITATCHFRSRIQRRNCTGLISSGVLRLVLFPRMFCFHCNIDSLGWYCWIGMEKGFVYFGSETLEGGNLPFKRLNS